MLSALVPGLGQMATGHLATGVRWLVVMTLGGVAVLWTLISAATPGFVLTAMIGLLLFILWVLMLIQAYRQGTRPAPTGTSWPWIAAWLSYLLPGLGQLCRRQWWTGIGFLAAALSLGLLPDWRAVVVGIVLAIASAVHVFGRQPGWQWLRWGVGLRCVGGMVLMLLVRQFVVQPFHIPTNAMAPTLMGTTESRPVGDHIFVEKIAYHFRSPRRGEIVVFRTDEIQKLPEFSRGKFYVKRVVGLPGERVGISPPHVLINGRAITSLSTQYALPSSAASFETVLAKEDDSMQLGPDEYFVLGDNTLGSLDSRYWGAVRRKAIVGRVVKVYWPLDRAGITLAR